MSMTTFLIILKAVIFISALVALIFGVALLFFYERFSIFNELVNTQYFIRKKGPKGGGYLLDNWVMGWHTFFGIIALIIGIWLFWVFFRYLAL